MLVALYLALDFVRGYKERVNFNQGRKMKERVLVKFGGEPDILERIVNGALQRLRGTLVDIKYDAGEGWYSALIIYIAEDAK
jgi:hypothetical protein